MDSHPISAMTSTPTAAENSFVTLFGIVKSRPRNEIWVASSLTRTTISRTSKTPRLRRSLLPMSPQSAIRVRVAAAGQDGAAVPAAEESLVWGWQAVGSAESGCRGVVQWRGEGLVGERAAAYEAIEVSSRRFEIHVYDPERAELEVSGDEDEALPDLVGKFDAVKGAIPAGAWNAARSTKQTTKRRCARLQGC